jgi:hypothetical protein
MADKSDRDRSGTASSVSRRAFLSTGAASAMALTGAVKEAEAQAVPQIKWDRSADVVIIGAGVPALPRQSPHAMPALQ